MRVNQLSVRALAALMAVYVLNGCECGPSSRPLGGDSGLNDGASDSATDVGRDGCTACGSDCCVTGERCFGGTQCVADFGPCTTSDECPGDSYCDFGRCTPYGVPPTVTNDPLCVRSTEGGLEPQTQCSWTSSSTAPLFDQVYSTPMVADFGLDGDTSQVRPSIVFTSFRAPEGDTDYRLTDGGILRVIDGRTCIEQSTLAEVENRLTYSSNNAIGDLDRAADGRPEIVGVAYVPSTRTVSGLIAFKYNGATSRFERLWYGRNCNAPGQPRFTPAEANQSNAGPSIHDLDDDGVPEILHDMWVYDANGCVLNPSRVATPYLSLGTFPIAADIDGDAQPELVHSSGVYRWDTASRNWALESFWTPSVPIATRTGHIAVANFDMGELDQEAEIVVASAPTATSNNLATGTVRVMNFRGQVIFGPYDLPGGGRGGPPTIADFDGDGRREFGVAGAGAYTVFDLDCVAGNGPGCARTNETRPGILWSRASQDASSNVTGSSVFDFDGDGVAEVVYRDECFLRIYRGTDGFVLYSSGVSSGTGYDYPVIVDADGDFNTEIVVPSTNGQCMTDDPIFTLGTSPPRSTHGIFVLRDAQDRWVPSRTIWNQHAYSITNVLENGSIPRTSTWMANHRDRTLNNFRMNTQGVGSAEGLADLTVQLAESSGLCEATEDILTLNATVCNRGTNPAPDGARVVFYSEAPMTSPIACETTLGTLLQPSTCTTVNCVWTRPAGSATTGITVVVDPENVVTECRNGNNQGVAPDVLCRIG